jgi:hypothetical protein
LSTDCLHFCWTERGESDWPGFRGICNERPYRRWPGYLFAATPVLDPGGNDPSFLV